MKIALILLITFCTLNGFAQCNVNEDKVENNTYRYSMTESIYRNADLENGMQGVFISANTIQDKTAGKIFYTELVVTYCYTSPKPSMIPNEILIHLGDDKSIHLRAKSKSYQTINLTKPMPDDIHAIECTFTLASADVALIFSSKTASLLDITDYTTGDKLSVPFKFGRQLGEMIACTIDK
jgi:hypothetical protein